MKKLFAGFIQLLSSFVIGLSLFLVFGQAYYWLGVGLNFSRWFLVVLGIGFTYIAYKKAQPNRQKLLFVSVLFLLVDWGFHRVQYQSLDDPESAKEISVMSYNVFFKNGYPKQALHLITASHPDVLLIQELTPAWHQRLLQRFGKQYPYRIAKPLKGTHGIGIYSKYPISQVHYLNNSSHLPIAQSVRLKLENRWIQLTNMHLASPSRAVEHPKQFKKYMEANAKLRISQFDRLKQHVEKYKGKTTAQLIIGDANTLPYEPLYRNIRKSYDDIHSRVGGAWGWTFPNTAKVPFPFLRLDYALVKGKVKPISMNVLEGGSSDHLPILVKMAL